MTKDRPLSRIELLQGTLDLLILQTLRWGQNHGYGIAQIRTNFRTSSRRTPDLSRAPSPGSCHRRDWEVREQSACASTHGRPQALCGAFEVGAVAEAIAGVMVLAERGDGPQAPRCRADEELDAFDGSGRPHTRGWRRTRRARGQFQRNVKEITHSGAACGSNAGSGPRRPGASEAPF